MDAIRPMRQSTPMSIRNHSAAVPQAPKTMPHPMGPKAPGSNAQSAAMGKAMGSAMKVQKTFGMPGAK